MSCPASPIPVWVPPLVALFASTTRGLTGFGDGIAFQSLWAACTAVGLLGPADCHSLRKSVLFATVMQALTLPLQIYHARQTLPTIAAYVAVMVVGGSLTTYGGAWVLLNTSDVHVLKNGAGTFFLLFSLFQGSNNFYALLRARAAKPGAATPAPASATAPAPAPPRAVAVVAVAQPTATVAAESTEAAESSGEAVGEGGDASAVHDEVQVQLSDFAVDGKADGVEAWEKEENGEEEDEDGEVMLLPPPSSCASRLAAAFPQLSPTVAPTRMLVYLTIAAAAGGFLGGVFGAGGPPLMAVYSVLSLDKDVLRGFGIVPSCFMAVRLLMYTTGEGAVFDVGGEGWVYVAIAAAAFTGSTVGNHLRDRFDVAAMVRMILMLVYTSAWLMLGLFLDAGVTVTAALMTAAWATGAAVLWRRGAKYAG
jgi:hypothetical protein